MNTLATVSRRANSNRPPAANTLTPGYLTNDALAGPKRRMRLMGAPVGVVTEAYAVETIIGAAETGRGHWTITVNLDHLRRYHCDPVAKVLIDDADLVVADGMPLIWASRIAGEPLPERVSGSSMVWSICELACARGQSVFLLGGDPGVAMRAADVFRCRYPGLDIAGTACPPVGFEHDERELERIRREVCEAAPQIVFVALGFPKQDLLIRSLRSSLPNAAFLGVGISLSYATGDLSRAPDWLCSLGLEWAYRLSQEPTFSLIRRYVVDGLPFAVRLMASAIRQRSRRVPEHGSQGPAGESLATTAPETASESRFEAEIPGFQPRRKIVRSPSGRAIRPVAAMLDDDIHSKPLEECPTSIAYVIGARPNFVKMAPVISELRRRLPDVRHTLIHTGQHYDRLMSDVFLEELGVPEPDHMLGVGSASHAVQTARVMERIEPVLEEERPDLLIVPGDVNSTLAATLVAVKLGIPVAHLEAGLRSFDRTMPEEINRIVADEFSDHLFLHSEEAIVNLRAEGIPEERMHFVGNTMIDSLVAVEERFRNTDAASAHGLAVGDYLLVTLHRPALVDGPLLAEVIAHLSDVSRELPVLFPVHPRTRKTMESMGLDSTRAIRVTEPVSYLEFLSLEADARAVLTDSGGVQEETTYLGVPCFTLRDNTERPVTIRAGTNTLLGLDPGRIAEILPALEQPKIISVPPDRWDGRAAERIGDVLATSTESVAARQLLRFSASL
jgi:UDP-N-acetylglucosamine 2-epimerase (non-hydrolysing)